MKSISFIRRYHGYTGGHQKVRDYLEHARAYGFKDIDLFLDNKAQTETQLFSNIEGIHYQDAYHPKKADIAFLAGLDWQQYLPIGNDKQVKVNLIQHVRHGNPKHPLFAFLKHRAVRICVSDAVKDAIEKHANGPCITIKMGHNIPVQQFTTDDSSNNASGQVNHKANKPIDLYILANKQPQLGQSIAQWAVLKGLRCKLHDQVSPKSEVLQAMSDARVTLALPNRTEGFYLPGIEAMSLSDAAVIPDCIANREYIKGFSNAFISPYNEDDIKQSIEQAFKKTGLIYWPIFTHAGQAIARRYQLAKERKHFHEVLNDLDSLW